MFGVKNNWTFIEGVLAVIMMAVLIVSTSFEYYLLALINIPVIIYIGYLDYNGKILLDNGEGSDEDYLKFKFLMKLDSFLRMSLFFIISISTPIQQYFKYPKFSLETSSLVIKILLITYISYAILYGIAYIWGNRELKKLYKKLGIENN